ncbi:hypothetical protein R1sor_019131 [Riccia sorocarpa]|uniref:EF-hand domain-containing protein n=1 Tax=Riccia sorocarpa TaxID=122646 RepID=A0ABD3IDD8_9MARC
MKEPLIQRESGGRSDRFRFFRALTLDHKRAIASGLERADAYERAAAYVDLADNGVGIPSEVLEQQDNKELTRSFYFAYTLLDPFWNLTMAALILLNFFEVPLWCTGDFPNPCGSREEYYLGGLPYLTRGGSLICEIVIFVILVVYTLFPILFMGQKLFWSDPLNNANVVLLFVLAVDTLLDLSYVTSTGPISSLSVRVAPYVRVILVAVNSSQVRANVKTLVRVLPDFLDATNLLALFILFSSWLGYVLFQDTDQGREVFTSFGRTLYGMTVLFTTSNNPDLWLTAYKQARSSGLFFILYILVGVYFITNLVLAIIYESFKEQLAEHFLQMDEKGIECLDKAFRLLDEQKTGYLSLNQCFALFEKLKDYRTLPKIDKDQMEYVFRALDVNGDFKIDMDEFKDLCQAITLKFEKQELSHWLEAFPFYKSSSFQSLQKFVRSKHFEYIIYGILGLNLIVVIIETSLGISNHSSQLFWQEVELVFGWLYLVELALKVLACGFRNYWRSMQNRFDFFVTWIIVIGETLIVVLPNGFAFFSTSGRIRYLLIAQVLRLFRGLMLIERYRVKVGTFIKLIRHLLPYLGINFFLMCIYCTMGVQVFGGLVYEGNLTLERTTMFENDYLVYNFNDYVSGMVTLFNVLVMGNWEVWMESYAVLTQEWLAVTYFISFYVLGVLLIFNLVISFVLEAFFAQAQIDEERQAMDTTPSGHRGTSVRERTRRGQYNRQNLIRRMLEVEMKKKQGEPVSDE